MGSCVLIIGAGGAGPVVVTRCAVDADTSDLQGIIQ